MLVDRGVTPVALRVPSVTPPPNIPPWAVHLKKRGNGLDKPVHFTLSLLNISVLVAQPLSFTLGPIYIYP